MVLDLNYINLKKQVITAERRVLKELGFCVHVKHPHKVSHTMFPSKWPTFDKKNIQNNFNVVRQTNLLFRHFQQWIQKFPFKQVYLLIDHCDVPAMACLQRPGRSRRNPSNVVVSENHFKFIFEGPPLIFWMSQQLQVISLRSFLTLDICIIFFDQLSRNVHW